MAFISALILFSVTIYSQAESSNKVSLELEPGFAFVHNSEVEERNFGAARPLFQVNYRAGKVFEPHVRVGYLFTWSRTREKTKGYIFGIGSRIQLAHFIIKKEKILKDIRLYGFVNFSIANYSPGGEEFFYRLPGFEDRIFRTGGGIVFPASKRFNTKIEIGYARRSHSLIGRHGTVGATSLIYNF